MHRRTDPAGTGARGHRRAPPARAPCQFERHLRRSLADAACATRPIAAGPARSRYTPVASVPRANPRCPRGRDGGLSSTGRAADCGSAGYGFDPRRPPQLPLAARPISAARARPSQQRDSGSSYSLRPAPLRRSSWQPSPACVGGPPSPLAPSCGEASDGPQSARAGGGLATRNPARTSRTLGPELPNVSWQDPPSRQRREVPCAAGVGS